MLKLTKRACRARKQKARRLISQGHAPHEVAERIGVTRETVRRWLRKAGPASPKEDGGPPKTPRSAGQTTLDTVTEMVRAELPAVMRVLIDMAKGGDVRAATLVIKQAGNETTDTEGTHEQDPEAEERAVREELRSLPAAIASEIVGLLAEAEGAREGGSGGRRAASGGAGGGPMQLPWGTESEPSDEGVDSV